MDDVRGHALVDDRRCYEPRPEVVAVELDGEFVLLETRAVSVHHLNRTASTVWALLTGGVPLAEVVADLASAFGAPREVIAEDVRAMVADLLDRELLRAAPAATG